MMTRWISVARTSTWALLGCALMSACVPLPYRPSVAIHHDYISAEAASAILLKADSSASLGKVAADLQRAEPRIVLIDPAGILQGPTDFIALPDVIAELATLPTDAAAPDFLLGLSALTTKQVHDTDYYMPLVGYTKTEYVARLPASIVELRSVQRAEALTFQSDYSMMVAQLFYGIMTIPMPEGAIHSALVDELLRRLRTGRPTGPIRLVVMSQK